MTTASFSRAQLGPVLAKRGSVGRWTVVALGFLLVAALVSAGILLYTRYPSALGRLDVVTMPPGAEVWLDGRRIGSAPCTIERVAFGPHTLRAVRDGFLLAEQEVVLEQSGAEVAVSFVLQPVRSDPPLSAVGDGAPTERIAEFMQHAADAFQRGDLVAPANDNALYYADAVLLIQPDNGPASDLRASIRDTLIRQAELAAGRGDLAAAQSTYTTLLTRFPSDERSKAGVARIAELIEANRGQAARFLARAEAAMADGRYLDPPQASAYFYLSQVLAHDRGQTQAQTLRAAVRRAAQEAAEAYVAQGRLDRAVAEYRRLARLFPEDRALSLRLRQLERQQADDQALPAAVSLPAARQSSARQSAQPGTLRFSAAGLAFASPSGAESLSIPTEAIATMQASRGRLTVTLSDGATYQFTGRDLERGVKLWQSWRHSSAAPDQRKANPTKTASPNLNER
ncbi:MAG: hypothetical protein CFK52_10705 [Chloracidobacterium sp. CP2_5A]|nr:MAG: hypothetical protein CFK52_10705 [Chloracidobacterium sp. CP2_5A]